MSEITPELWNISTSVGVVMSVRQNSPLKGSTSHMAVPQPLIYIASADRAFRHTTPADVARRPVKPRRFRLRRR